MNLHDRDNFLRGKKEGLSEGITQGISQGAYEKAIETAKKNVKEQFFTWNYCRMYRNYIRNSWRISKDPNTTKLTLKRKSVALKLRFSHKLNFMILLLTRV